MSKSELEELSEALSNIRKAINSLNGGTPETVRTNALIIEKSLSLIDEKLRSLEEKIYKIEDKINKK